ncbi:MAG: DNA mismatch repair protein MutS [Ruminococcaceae bacterium]|nr:DNA mismatch repair protein MutS [Oscillospiraceae bacterium]
MSSLSPMMRQYFEIKADYQDTILMFRVGDFYEMFYDDAKLVSKELELVLTGKDCGQSERAPMCGVPFHAADSYIARLVSRGYKVAVCEQAEDPASAKGIVKREVIRVVTPGTTCDSAILNEGTNNYLCCIFAEGRKIGVCFCDVSTGTMLATEFSKNAENELINELSKYQPKEILLNCRCLEYKKLKVLLGERLDCIVDEVPDDAFALDVLSKKVLSHFHTAHADELELGDKPLAMRTVGKALVYLEQTQKTDLKGITHLDVYSSAQFMHLDSATVRNLELCETMRGKENRGSLLWVVDKTKTAMGKRMLRAWIEKPLIHSVDINKRLNAVEELFSDIEKRSDLRECLHAVLDIERIITKIVYKTASAKELRALQQAVENLPTIKALLTDCNSEILRNCGANIDALDDIFQLIFQSIVKDPPATIREGGMIKAGFNAELDALRDVMQNGQEYLNRIEAQEKEKTGIKSLKINYNKVYGYYLEVTNLYKDLVPEHYIRKQTLTNAERYITEELKQLEDKILGAKERSVQLESEIFSRVRDKVAAELERIQRTALHLALADCIQSLAQAAADYGYVRPDVNEGDSIVIQDGRHPVVERMMKEAPFVPNDTLLDCRDNRMLIITGPNMAGKSTFMRQVAVITLMAQIGSFVPAASATIGVTDAIFTRVGASDDLTAGQSTFMVEMSEVATILKNATKKSLIIYDEIGRGTSTFDGMSIARAVLEYTADKKKLGAKTLFATHYHELTAIENEVDGIKNYNIAVKKRDGEIIFLRRIVAGGTDDSYGIDVAKLAGVPKDVIARAGEVLKELEAEGSGGRVIVKEVPAESEAQMSFALAGSNEITQELKQLDVNTLTPIEAMEKLYSLSKRAKEES